MALTDKAQTFETRARDLLEQGFRTKSAQQDAISYTNTAFDYLKDEVRKAQIAAAPSGDSQASYQLRSAFFAERDIPYQLNHIRDKHLPLFDEFTPGLRADLERLLDLRAQIKAAPVAPKAAPKGPAVAAPDELRMTCQICGRAIHANTGRIAHHGYQRPGYGYQTASCPGALELPFELSRDELGKYIEGLNRRFTSLNNRELEHMDGMITELTVAIIDREQPRQYGRPERTLYIRDLTAETFAAQLEQHGKSLRNAGIRSFRDALERDKRESELEAKLILGVLEESEKRYNGWKQTHSWNGEAYVPA